MTPEDYAERIQSELRKVPGQWAIIGQERVANFEVLDPDMVAFADAVNAGEGVWAPAGSFQADVIGCEADGAEFKVPTCQLFARAVGPEGVNPEWKPSYRMSPEEEFLDSSELDWALRELLLEVQAEAARNREWAAKDADADFRQQSVGRAEVYEYMVDRLREILGEG